jgi:acetaldehyde dehydrogenase (acetylating)
MTTVTQEGTQELMKQREVAVILATGGMGLVRAAYSAGKPAYGVGPGNAPCYIESSADLAKAAWDILTGKCFDNGVLCSSPNSVVVDEAVAEETRRQFQARGGYFLKPAEADALAKVLVSPQRLPNPALVGKPATLIAEKAGFTVPAGTCALIAELTGVGRDFPLSIEKLCPVLSFYVVRDWREGCERCKEILRYGGMGHTMSIHSKNDAVILEFGLHKPAFRICVNTPTTHGSIGLTTGLDPAMTLGCGGFGGNITSDNISPKHLLNIKRLAYEIRPAVPAATLSAAREAGATAPAPASSAPASDRRLPQAPPAPPPGGIGGDQLIRRVDQFLKSRGFAGAAASESMGTVPATSVTGTVPSLPPDAPAEFVCEDDVRQAMRANRRISVTERTIITPAARDLGESHGVFATPGVTRQ